MFRTKVTMSLLEVTLASYSPSILFLTSRSSWGGWKWFQMISHFWKPWVWHQKQVFRMVRTKVKILLLVRRQPLSPTSVILFFTSRSSWGSWKWSQMIFHFQKTLNHGFDTKNKYRTKVTKLHEVIFGLQQSLHPVLCLQVELRLMEMVPNDFPFP